MNQAYHGAIITALWRLRQKAVEFKANNIIISEQIPVI